MLLTAVLLCLGIFSGCDPLLSEKYTIAEDPFTQEDQIFEDEYADNEWLSMYPKLDDLKTAFKESAGLLGEFARVIHTELERGVAHELMYDEERLLVESRSLEVERKNISAEALGCYRKLLEALGASPFTDMIVAVNNEESVELRFNFRAINGRDGIITDVYLIYVSDGGKPFDYIYPCNGMTLSKEDLGDGVYIYGTFFA